MAGLLEQEPLLFFAAAHFPLGTGVVFRHYAPPSSSITFRDMDRRNSRFPARLPAKQIPFQP